MAALATVPRVIGWCRRGVVRQDAARHASTTPLARSRYASAGCPSAAHGDKPTSVASPVRFDDLPMRSFRRAFGRYRWYHTRYHWYRRYHCGKRV